MNTKKLIKKLQGSLNDEEYEYIISCINFMNQQIMASLRKFGDKID